VNPLFVRILTAAVYAVGATYAAYQAMTPPLSIEGYIGLGVTFVVTFWAKFSSSTTFVAPNRAGETF
jgi:hypothetical protein